MERSLRIQLAARSKTLRSITFNQRRRERTKWKRYQLELRNMEKGQFLLCKRERRIRREDWFGGSLAPMRDVGLIKEKYGAMQASMTQFPDVPREWNARAPPDYSIVAGDRVVVVNGPDRIKGQIGQVQDVDKAKQIVTIIGVNVIDAATPENAPRAIAGQDNPPFTTMEAPLSLKDVRLVRPLSSPDNPNVYQDYIVRHITRSGPYVERRPGSNLPNYTRYVTGSSNLSVDGKLIEIPWPEERMLDDAPRRTPADTPSLYVDRQTYDPSIYTAPLGYFKDTVPPEEGTEEAILQHNMTQSIFDELRNKYALSSPYSADFVQRKILEDARSIWYRERSTESVQTMFAREHNAAKKEVKEKAMRGVMKMITHKSIPDLMKPVRAMKTFTKRSGAVRTAAPAGQDRLGSDVLAATRALQSLNLELKTMPADRNRVAKSESQTKKLAKEATTNKDFRELKRKGEMIPRHPQGKNQRDKSVSGTLRELTLDPVKSKEGKIVWQQYTSIKSPRIKVPVSSSTFVPPATAAADKSTMREARL